MNKIKVLIVDDEHDFAATLAERLCLRSYDARIVVNACETLSLIDKIKPDVVLLDLNLQGISGIEILMTLKNVSPEVEVILLTGHMDIARSIEGLRLDSFHYIFKPFDIRELTEKIDAVTAKHGRKQGNEHA
ncbi:MAG: response regulator [Thermodesulfovibrio sp.]|nr:response regulator [Thermodesulfovibrio sp.]